MDEQTCRARDGRGRHRRESWRRQAIAAILVILVLGVLAGYLLRRLSPEGGRRRTSTSMSAPERSTSGLRITIRRPRPRPRARARAGQASRQIGRGMFGRAPAPRRGMSSVETRRRSSGDSRPSSPTRLRSHPGGAGAGRRRGLGGMPTAAQRARRAGPGHADPDHDLAADWVAARAAIDRAQAEI